MTANSKVLIIDDEPIARESLEALLAGEDYDLYFASNGSEGLTKARALRPDAILLDVMMPGMDGYEVCRRLRAEPDLALIAVIMITALDDRTSRLNGLRAGADEFLSKPYDSVELRARLETIASLGRYRRLLAERTRFEWMVEQSEEGYLILDGSGHITYANPQARIYMNLTADGLGQSFIEAARRQYLLEPEELWQQNRGGFQVEGPRFLVMPETETARAFWLQVDELNSSLDGERAVQIKDVTNAVTAYQDMRRFQNAIVHKLRTPLIAMHGSLNLLANYGTSMQPQEAADFARAALAGVERLRQEIDDVLQYINAPVLATNGQTEVDWFAARVSALGNQLGIEAMAVRVHPSMVGQTLPLSTQAIDCIFWELLENSKKFHPNETPAVSVVLEQTGDRQIQIQVVDDGVTLTPQQIRWALAPYLQGEKYFTGEMPGMGLGLPLVATLVWRAGGTVTLANREDGTGLVVSIGLNISESTDIEGRGR